MKKQVLLSIVLIFLLILSTNAQIAFEKVLPQSSLPHISNDFEGVSNSGLDYSDVDNDGDQDVLITGTNRLNQRVARLYMNDGTGNFSEITGTPFTPVNYGNVLFFNADGDGDEDVLITGMDISNQYIAKLYLNDGSGVFTEVIGTPFEAIYGAGGISIADIDGDNDQDILIAGSNASNQRIAKLYTNNGSGVFSEVLGTPFEGVSGAGVSFADIDGDNDQDVLITGYNSSNQRIAKLYTNNGSGVFSEVLGTPFEPVNNSRVLFSDIDGDNDQDVFLTGYSSNLGQRVSKLYTNNGSGVFSEVLATPFEGIQQGDVSFADVDGDSDQDLLITGINNSNQSISKLYINNGSGAFSLAVDNLMEGVRDGALSFLDIDNDSDLDLLLTGSGYNYNKVAKLFVNAGSGFFLEVTGSTFTSLGLSSNKFSDIDNDGDEDLLISGIRLNQYVTELYKNNGSGEYTLEQAGIPINDFFGEVSFIDIDGDNDEDLIFVGYILPYQPITKLYRNDGSGNFTEILGTSFVGLTSSSIAYADIDGDNDQDLLIAGRDSSNNRKTLLYSNDGNGNYQLVSGTPFTGIFNGSIAFADVDGDNDQDVLVTGTTDNYSSYGISRLYTNNGSGVFSYVSGTPFDAVRTSAIAFADIDSDGDQDVLITGRNSSNEYISKLYDNDGSGGFTLNTDSTLQSYSTKRAVGFTDIDGDSDLDLIMIGGGDTNLYTNDSFGVFTLETNTILEGVSNGSLAFSDIDNDDDMDVLISGKNLANEETTFLYRNLSVPIPPIISDIPSLSDVIEQCEATATAPSANGGTITATSDVNLPITTQGTTIVIWTYDDGVGNTLTQTQNIIVNDTTGPSMSFVDPSDAIVDSCSNAVIVTSPLALEDCLINNFALDFDGVDDSVTVNQPIGNIGTMEFWMYTENGINGSEDFDYIFTFNNSNLIYVGTGNVSVDFAGETLSIVTNFGQVMTISEVIPPGWNHIAITGNGSVYNKILLNGVNQSTVNLGFPIAINALILNIGQFPASTNTRFLGQLDEIRFWNTPRSEQEIADNFGKLIDATSPNLLAYYDFEDGTGSSVLSDMTSTSANGVLNNMDVNTDWISAIAPVASVTLTNDFNGTSDASGTYPEGETMVTWTAVDANGNTNTLQQIINSGDTEGPEISFSDPSHTYITSCDTNLTIPSPLVSDKCSENTGLSFDGTNDYVNLGSPLLSASNGSQAQTVEMWIKSTPKNAYTMLFSQYGFGALFQYRTVFYINTAANGGNLQFFKGSYVNIAGTTNLLDDQWHHVAMVREGSGTLSLYVDGVVEAVGIDTHPYSNTNFLLGGQTLLPDNYYKGVMDEVRIWNTARTQTQITNSFNANISDSESGLVAYYKCEDGTGSGVISDDSSNSNDGILTNMDINSDWVPSTAPVNSVILTNDFNGTSDASGTYPQGETTVTWTATDSNGNQSTLEQIVNIVCSITYTFNNDVWTPSDPNGAATAIDDLVITSGNAAISSNTTVNSVTVEAGASLTIDAALTAADITLNSTSISYASLLTGLSGSASGSISYNRFVNSNILGNDLISPPLSGQTWTSFLDPINATALLSSTGSPTVYAFAPFDKSTGDYENYDFNTIATLASGTGYRAATNIGETLTFTGAVPANVSVNIIDATTSYSEWNLVGNPYPSYINVQAFLSYQIDSEVSNIDLFVNETAAIYGYDGNAQNGWTIYNLSNTTATTLIAPGQGFFVAADASRVNAYDLEFTTDMQTTGTDDDFIVNRNAELVYLKLGLSSNTKTYSTGIYFNSNASPGLDKGYDAALWGSTAPGFSIYSHLLQDNLGKPIALQTLNQTNLSDVSIPLGVNANQSEQISFSISESTLPETVNVYLDDVVANTSTLLNNGDYIITPTTNLSGTGRFFLRTTEEGLLILENNLDNINVFYLNSSKELVVNGHIQNNTTVEIYDIQGRKVFSSTLDSSVIENHINLASLNGGVYLVNLRNNTQQKSQKFIIK